MAVRVIVSVDAQGLLTASINSQPVPGSIFLKDLPLLPALQANPYSAGLALTAALGGDELLHCLQTDPERLLVLDATGPAVDVPWEFAALEGRHLLATGYGFLRLVPDAHPASPAPLSGMLHFLVLAADPLVDTEGRPREEETLDLEGEVRAIRSTLERGGCAVHARRVPPTQDALLEALTHGPAFLHLSCHGKVVKDHDRGEIAVLLLEDSDGGPDDLPGPDLATMSPPGVLRLVTMSSCHTSARQASLARALVRSGVPAAVGMQGAFPDPLGGEFASGLYRMLLAGHPLGESLRQARLALRRYPDAVGLPVAYVAPGGWEPLPLTPGRPNLVDLGLAGLVRLPPEVHPPRPLLGRNRELHTLAREYSQGSVVVTIVGAGGMGKTALAAAFAERFAWRWPHGVLGISFASGRLDAGRFVSDLLQGLLGADAARGISDLPIEEQTRAVLDAARDWDGLLLLDNYESVLQHLVPTDTDEEPTPLSEGKEDHAPSLSTLRELLRSGCNDQDLRRLCNDTPALKPALSALGSGFSLDQVIDALLEYCEKHDLFAPLMTALLRANPRVYWRYFSGRNGLPVSPADADAIHRLTFQLAESGTRLLLTSRKQPAGLRGESLFPDHATPLSGLPVLPATHLFLEHSARAKAEGLAARAMAAEIAAATEGHPLAVTLLAGAYDNTEQPPEEFLAKWNDELVTARREGLAPHHRTFQAAFRRSYDVLPPHLQSRLRALSAFPFPFMGQGAAFLWGETPDKEIPTTVREDLGRLVRASLLEVEGYFEDGSVATYRFQPTLRQAVAWEAEEYPSETAARAAGYATYGAWLARLGCQQIHYDMALARLVRLSMDSLETATEILSGTERLRHAERLAWLKRSYGDVRTAYALLSGLLPVGAPLPDPQSDPEGARVNRDLRVEFANLCRIRGETDRAIVLFEESLWIDEQLGNLGAKANTLHEMGILYATRGDLDRALALHGESLRYYEQMGEFGAQAASLHQMATVYHLRQDLDQALPLLELSLKLREQVGDLQGKCATLHEMAYNYSARGDKNRAIDLYRQSLEISERLGDLRGKAATLGDIAMEYASRGELEPALALASEGLRLFQQSGDRRNQAISLGHVAAIFLARGDLDRAQAFCDESLRILEQIDDHATKADVLQAKAIIQVMRGNVDTAGTVVDPGKNYNGQLGDPMMKIDVLRRMAGARAARGELDQALSIYEQSLPILDQIGDRQGRADVLFEMAWLCLNRRDLDRALELYGESLEIAEQIDYAERRSGCLNEMGRVFAARGEFDQALGFYDRSLHISEEIGDQRGKAAAFHEMAEIFLRQGDIDRSISLFEDSLSLYEQIGDLDNQYITLPKLATAYSAQESWQEAEQRLRQYLSLAESLGDWAEVAFAKFRLSQVVDAQGDEQAAQVYYRESLSLCETLTGPKGEQVRAVIAHSDGRQRARITTPLDETIARARTASQRGDKTAAVAAEEEAIALIRALDNTADAREALRAELVNLATYYTVADRLDNALHTLEELIAIDEQVGHPDLETHRLLAQMLRLTTNLPQQLQTLMQEREKRVAELTPEGKAQLEAETWAFIEKMLYVSPERVAQPQEAALADDQTKIDDLAEQAQQAAIAALRGEVDSVRLAARLDEVAGEATEGEDPGSPWDDLAHYLRALGALLRVEPVPFIPEAYVSLFKTVQAMQMPKRQ